MVEYALLVALVGVMSVAGLLAVNRVVTSAFTTLATSLSTRISQAPASGTPGVSAYAAQVLADGGPDLIGYWRLNEAAGASVAADSTTFQRDGAVYGTVEFGHPGGGLSSPGFPGPPSAADPKPWFDLASGRIDVDPNDDPAFNVTSGSVTAGTIEAWIRTSVPTSDTNYHAIVVKQYCYGMYVYAGRLVGYDYSVGQRDSGVQVNDNQWHHVVETFTNAPAQARVSVYVDGNLANAFPSYTAPFTSGHLAISNGASADVGLQEFSGNIAEVALYDRVLTWTEISNHYVLGRLGT